VFHNIKVYYSMVWSAASNGPKNESVAQKLHGVISPQSHCCRRKRLEKKYTIALARGQCNQLYRCTHRTRRRRCKKYI